MPRYASAGADKAPYTIDAIGRAMAVLEALRERAGELSLAQVSDLTGLHKPTAFRVLATLRQHGMVLKNDRTGLYRLGYTIVALAESAKAVGGLVVEARPVMRRLRDSLRHSVYLSVLDGEQRIDIEQIEGLEEMRRVITPGKLHPLHFGSPSEVLAAHLPEAQLDAALARTAPRDFDAAAFRRRMRAVRRQGYACSDNRRSALAVSAPVRVRGEVIAAISCSAPPMFASARERMIAEVMQAGVAIAAALEGTRPGND